MDWLRFAILMTCLTISSGCAAERYTTVLSECLWFEPVKMDKEAKQWLREHRDDAPLGVIAFLNRVAMNNRQYKKQCEEQ